MALPHTRARDIQPAVCFKVVAKRFKIKWLANKDCMQIIIYVHLDILTVFNYFKGKQSAYILLTFLCLLCQRWRISPKSHVPSLLPSYLRSCNVGCKPIQRIPPLKQLQRLYDNFNAYNLSFLFLPVYLLSSAITCPLHLACRFFLRTQALPLVC